VHELTTRYPPWPGADWPQHRDPPAVDGDHDVFSGLDSAQQPSGVVA